MEEAGGRVRIGQQECTFSALKRLNKHLRCNRLVAQMNQMRNDHERSQQISDTSLMVLPYSFQEVSFLIKLGIFFLRYVDLPNFFSLENLCCGWVLHKSWVKTKLSADFQQPILSIDPSVRKDDGVVFDIALCVMSIW